jgi:LPXTG-motif cell wall-anchored protein
MQERIQQMTKGNRALALIGLTMAFTFPVGVSVAGMAVAVDAPCYPAPLAAAQHSDALCATTTTVPDGDQVDAATVSATPAAPGTQVAATSATNEATLPMTGGDIAGLTILGGGAFAVGAVLVRRSRRSNHS